MWSGTKYNINYKIIKFKITIYKNLSYLRNIWNINAKSNVINMYFRLRLIGNLMTIKI